MGRDRDITADLTSVLAGRICLPTRIEHLRASYQNTVPFPHVVIDNLFAPYLLDPLLEEMAALQENQWLLVEDLPRERIRRMRSAVDLGPAGSQMLSLVHCASFLYLLSEITGIWQLLPDPYLQGAGYAAMRRGDFFNVHSDRNVAYDTGLSRRLAMIVFLNKAWEPGYNGQLELWNHAATHCDVSVEPVFNRTILFEVADPNYHGVPAPIACPEDRSRQSFIVYYHTVGTDEKSAQTPRTSRFAPGFYRADPRFRSFARQVTPPVLLKAVRKLVKFCFPALRRS
jgi:Rps23 Pro-64 3,4-dihydroxylase Tpa1-like proline 4-hydroxylase